MERPNIDWEIADPILTEKGLAQCESLALDLKSKYSFPEHETLLVVSPLKRTVQSYHGGLSWLVKAGVPVQLRAEWQETTANPCDIGTDASVMQREWPDLNFSSLDPLYPAKTGVYDPSEEALLKRATFARQWLFFRPEKYIIVMTHSGFLKRVVEGPKYENVEYRTYDFVDEDKVSTRTFKLVEVEQDQPLAQEAQRPSVL
ncbi:hypothetical protein BJ170DRAFT_677417 [Xylariales sp. AK1849]|nr:hypothetical protein BJ170DRAFT_677417 [Xylariales sp. AK1849]